MNQFEKDMEALLPAFEKRGLRLWFMHPKMRPIGMRGKLPIFMQVAKGPFDMIGHDSRGTILAIELKSNEKAKTRLPIIGKDKRGSGLQFHQLEALVKVYEAGGRSAVLWYNGGDVLITRGADLWVAQGQKLKSLPLAYFDKVKDLKGVML